MGSDKLNSKDIITIVLLSLINVLLFMASSLLYISPITILLMPIIYALIEGIVFFTIGVKVRKKGALFIYCAVRSLMGGYLPYLICYLVAGVLVEWIRMNKKFTLKVNLTISYVVVELLASLGGTFYPYVLAYKSFFVDKAEFVMQNNGENIIAAADMMHSWIGPALVIGIIIAAIIGSMIAQRIMKKHLLDSAGEDGFGQRKK